MPNLDRRLVKVQVSAELLFEMMTIGNVIRGTVETIEGIPPDAKFISSHFDDHTMTACFVFEHDSFGKVLAGGDIPYIGIVCRKSLETEGDHA